MSLFNCLKWPEMRPVARALVAKMHAGHAERAPFSIPAVDFVRVFAPGAPDAELAKVASRGTIDFTPTGEHGGAFTLAAGVRATLDLGREGLVMRLPERMSGHYELRTDAFHIEFNEGEELEGCKRILMLICNRVLSVDVSGERVDVNLPNKIFNLCVEFE